MSYVNDMETKEQKEQETLDISKLTRFQKRQIISLFEKFFSENMEITKGSFQVCPKCEKKHPRLIKGGKTKGGKQMYPPYCNCSYGTC